MTPDIRLTPAQVRVLPLVREGLSYRSIADRLGISPRTVENHVAAIALQLSPEPGVPRYRLVQRYAASR